MTRIILVRPGSTDFDEQGRIQGTLDVPLNHQGNDQAHQVLAELTAQGIQVVYCSLCQSAEQTANLIADGLGIKSRTLRNLQNLNQGLWQGKRIDELKEKQKKVYRQWQEQPETVCPPEGEMLSSAQQRVKTALDKLIKKHNNSIIALVAPEPLTSLVRIYLEQTQIGDLWECACECGSWRTIDIEPRQLAGMAANQT